jgi:hypothetical protein
MNHDRAKNARRLKNRLKVIQLVGLEVNNKTNIVHWPNPKVFAYRFTLSRKTDIALSGWEDRVSSEPAKCRKPKVSDRSPADLAKFEKKREGRIREMLALRAIPSLEATDSLSDAHRQGFDNALRILLPVIQSPYHRCDWRLYELYARLLCLRNSANSQAAFEKARLDILPNLEKMETSSQSRRNIRFEWLQQREFFDKWHKSTVTAESYFYKRFVTRVKFARELDNVQSSSGKDPDNGKGRSNRPRMDLLTRENLTRPKRAKPRCAPCAEMPRGV